MDNTQNQILFIIISVILGLSIGYIIPQSQITNLNQEITSSLKIIDEKNNHINQLEEKIIINDKKIEELTTSLTKYKIDIENLNTEMIEVTNENQELEKNYSELLELYNNLYFQEQIYNRIDFTDYTEIDPDNLISITSSRIYWEDVDRSQNRRVYKTHGSNYFTDFEHQIDFKIEIIEPGHITDRSIIDLWSLSEYEDRYEEANSIKLSAKQVGIRNDRFSLVFQQRMDGENTFSFHQFDNLSTGETYYATISRKDYLCQLQIYSEPERKNIVLDTGLLIGDDSVYSFLILTRSKEEIGDLWASSSGYVENLREKTQP